MNLHTMLLEREAAGRPVTVGLIGAGKFGTMFLAQARLTRGMHVVARRRSRRRARAAVSFATAGWHAEAFSAASLGDALKTPAHACDGRRRSADRLPEIEVIVEATGVPAAGIRHALGAIAHGKHIVMVNVEADALAGPCLRARRRRPAWSIASPGATSPR